MWDKIKTLPQYILPQHLLSRGVYHITRSRWVPLKTLLISCFIKIYKVDMQSAERKLVNDYVSFNDFFTRALSAGARSYGTSSAEINSPVDGAISQIGNVQGESVFQAKGKQFSLPALLANYSDLASRLRNGRYTTIYLSPRDYHRIHMPCDGELKRMVYVPGKLFSVNESTTRTVDELFARNERLICQFDTPHGTLAVVLVGALFVGNMQTVWHGEVNPGTQRQASTWDYDATQSTSLSFKKGDEIGRFNMGSTVILLFEEDHVSWDSELQAGTKLLAGNKLGVAPN